MTTAQLAAAIDAELSAYRASRKTGEVVSAWCSLERAHILSQPILKDHLKVHALMLGFAVSVRDAREIGGQLARLTLAPIGALTGRIPWGNTGRARISAFRAMPIPEDLHALLEDRAANS